jgi:hypothetical protein
MFDHGFGGLPREILGRAGKLDPVRERETFRTASLVPKGAGPRARTKTIVAVAGDRKMLWGGWRGNGNVVGASNDGMPQPNDLGHVR